MKMRSALVLSAGLHTDKRKTMKASKTRCAVCGLLGDCPHRQETE